MLMRSHILPHTLLHVPQHKVSLAQDKQSSRVVKTNHVMLRNTKAFVVDANVQNMEAAGESANELLKIPPPSMSVR